MDETKPVLSIGEYLRNEREKRNITVEQVASATKIGLKLLHALEADDFDSLPARPFVRGFVMAYSKYIGLDPQEVVLRFEELLTEKSGKKFSRPAEAPHIFVERDSPAENSKTLLSVVMGGFLVGAIVIFAFVKPSLKHKRHKKENSESVSNETLVTVASSASAVPSPAPSPVAPSAGVIPAATPLETLAGITASSPTPLSPRATPAAAPPKPTPSPTAAPTAKPTPPGKPTATPMGTTAIPHAEIKHMLAVRALEDSWIKYQADSFPVRQYTLRKGQKIFARARESIRFRCFRANGVEISLDGGITFKPFDNSKTLIIPSTKENELRAAPFSE